MLEAREDQTCDCGGAARLFIASWKNRLKHFEQVVKLQPVAETCRLRSQCPGLEVQTTIFLPARAILRAELVAAPLLRNIKLSRGQYSTVAAEKESILFDLSFVEK